MFKRALVSTSDKTGLIEFLKPLAAGGCEIVSTGGTSKFLRENGIAVKEVGEVTGFPEVMDGRVRTLHPKIHMGLLARSYVAEDMALLKQHGVTPFDLVVVNLYPFEAAFKKGLKDEELIEQIDIGGPSLLRASAKSHERVTVVCDPADYGAVGAGASGGDPGLKMRRRLAIKVFEHCAFYDAIVARALSMEEEGHDHDRGAKEEEKTAPSWMTAPTVTLPLRPKQKLRYGENPHQSAVWYESPFEHRLGLARAKQLQGKELSYNNLLDLEAAVGVVADFDEPACSIIKHLSPCGVACDRTIEAAYKRAFDADSISAFGGIVALNRTLTANLAEQLIGPFLECVIAPDVEREALKILSAKKNLRVLALANLKTSWVDAQDADYEVKSLRGGALIQTSDGPSRWKVDWKIVGQQPNDEVKRDLLFAQRVVRHVKSNAIVIAKQEQTLGICGGQTNRVDSVKWALERASAKKQSDVVLGSDAFFPFRDSIDIAAKNGVRWIIQPGGSLRDAEVENAARENGINMVITGTRHFKH